MTQNEIIKLILDRRQFQDDEHGIAKNRNHTHTEWLAILAEEFGEVGEAIVKFIFSYKNANVNNIKHELIDVAAVCVAWIEDKF